MNHRVDGLPQSVESARSEQARAVVAARRAALQASDAFGRVRIDDVWPRLTSGAADRSVGAPGQGRRPSAERH
jgi:hypothetical protein